MAYVTPKFTRGQIDKAGDHLVAGTLEDYSEITSDLVIINNWRSSHNFPLNSIHVTLRNRARKRDPRAITAQRIKRLSSIEAKLRRFSDMKLSRMHDIGGCRAIVRSVAAARSLVAVYKRSARKNPKSRSELVREYDYIACPKNDGYRSVHLVYRYRSPSPRHKDYDGLRIELQIRSRMQHIWATAVETVGTFIGQALKSSQGEEKWIRFFALMGSYIAMRERSPLVPNTPSNPYELRTELIAYAEQLDVVRHLDLYAAAVDAPVRSRASKHEYYFLLKLDPAERRITVTSYKQDELVKANTDYLEVEKDILTSAATTIKKDAVLVSVKSFAALKQAYPNYFLDTHRFIGLVNEARGKSRSS